MLWVDASRAAYEEFCDVDHVVCFDKTCLTSEYDLPLVNFVEINNHGKSENNLVWLCIGVVRGNGDV